MPLTTQTITLNIYFTGLILLMDPNAIGNPRGAPNNKVTPKINNDNLKPSSKNAVTSKNDID